MFRNKILIRAFPSSSSNLFLLPLSLSLSAPLPLPTLSLHLETLCWKLSRQWRLACLPQPSHILLIYQRAQSDAVARVVTELADALPSIQVGEEEEVKSELLIAKAVECGLRSIMLDQKWSCVGNNTFVESTFSCSEERSNLCAINVELLSVGSAISNGTKLTTWEKASSNSAYCTGKSNNSNDSRAFTHTSIASKLSCLALDFHTPRPASVNVTGDKSVALTEIQESVISLHKHDVEVIANVAKSISKPNSTCTCQPPAVKSANSVNGTDQYQVPSFTRKKRTGVHKDAGSLNKLTHADPESSTCKLALEEDTSIKRGVHMQSVSSENSQRKNDAFLSNNSSGNLAKVKKISQKDRPRPKRSKMLTRMR